jgi:endoglycosylceramidase
MRSVRAAGAAALASIAVTACAGAQPAEAGALPLLAHHGRWLTDPQGRVVILHGVQVDKFEPTAPIEFIDLSPENVQFMADQGFNLARVSLAYAGVEPTMGHIDDGYIDSYRAFDRQLAAAGIYDLVDMMQGQYSAAVGGWGFPDWMTQTDGLPNTKTAFPLGYFDNPAEERAWDNFWANAPAPDGVGLQDHYAAGVRHIAARFGDAPGLFGFEILNEPWPGSKFPTCASPAGCPPSGFDQTELTNFYRRIIPALRSADPHHPVLYEPNLLFDYGAATTLDPVGDPNAIFAFHNYCLGDTPGVPQGDPGNNCGTEEEMVFANAEDRAKRSGDGLLMDEWGNSADTNLIQRIAQEADQHMVGWADWAYEDCCNSPAAIVKDGTKPPTAPGNLNVPVLNALVRPYPQAIAGTPSSWSYEPSSRTFQLSYSTTLLDGRRAAGLQTEAFVPSLHYANRYRVDVTGAEVVAGLGSQHLVLNNCTGAAAVTLRITPGTPTQPPSCAEQPASTHRNGLTIVLPGTSRRCARRRTLTVRISRRAGVRIASATIYINGKRVRVVRGRALRRTITLHNLPRGRLRLKVVVRTTTGRRLVARRTYPACRAQR